MTLTFTTTKKYWILKSWNCKLLTLELISLKMVLTTLRIWWLTNWKNIWSRKTERLWPSWKRMTTDLTYFSSITRLSSRTSMHSKSLLKKPKCTGLKRSKLPISLSKLRKLWRSNSPLMKWKRELPHSMFNSQTLKTLLVSLSKHNWMSIWHLWTTQPLSELTLT